MTEHEYLILFYSLDFDCFWQRLGINYKQGIGYRETNLKSLRVLEQSQKYKSQYIVISKLYLKKVQTFVCGKKNIWSLNCQKLFITPLLEISSLGISLIDLKASNCLKSQHYQPSLKWWLLDLELCFQNLTKILWWYEFHFSIKCLPYFGCTLKNYLSLRPISFYYIRQIQCVVRTNGF